MNKIYMELKWTLTDNPEYEDLYYVEITDKSKCHTERELVSYQVAALRTTWISRATGQLVPWMTSPIILKNYAFIRLVTHEEIESYGSL